MQRQVRRFETLDTTGDTSDATGSKHNWTLPWASILAGEDAMRVVLILTIFVLLLDAGRSGHFPQLASSPGEQAMRVNLVLGTLFTRLATLLNAGTSGHSLGLASSLGNLPCA